MPAEITEAMVREAFSQAGEATVGLVTLTCADGAVLRYTDRPEGFVSRGQAYAYAPMRVSGGGAGPGEPARNATLTLGGDAVRPVVAALRTATARAVLTGEEVRASAPDVVEIAHSAEVVESAYVAGEVELTVATGSYKDEPACHARYVIARVPGLF